MRARTYRVPTHPKLSAYELDRLARIEAIKNNPRMMEIEKEVREITQGMKKPNKTKAAPKPHNKHEDGPPQRSQRLKETEGTVEKEVDVTTQADQMEVDERAEVSIGNSEKGDASTQNAQASSESCEISLSETLPINLAVPNPSIPTPANNTPQDDTNAEGHSSEALPDCSKAPDWVKMLQMSWGKWV